MITTDEYSGAELFDYNGVLKQMYITYDDGVITNEDIHFENFELTESLCSDQQLTFGACEASSVKFRCSNVGAELKGKPITIDLSITDVKTQEPWKTGVYSARLASATLGKTYYELENANYLLRNGDGTFKIVVKFNQIPYYQDADVYIRIDNTNVPVVNNYFTQDPSEYVKGRMLKIDEGYVLTYIRTTVGSVKSYYFGLRGILSDERFRVGTYYVENAKKINEKRWLEVTAYDAMYYILNKDVTEWYDTTFDAISIGMTVKEMRLRFFSYIGVEQEDVDLVNDSIVMKSKVIDTNNGTTKVTGGDIIRAICEVNGCFGHIGRDNKFHYITLEVGMYTLYPQNNVYPEDETIYPNNRFANINYAKNSYITANYEDFYTAPIDGINVVDKDRGTRVYRAGNNMYQVIDNLIVRSTYDGQGHDDMAEIAQNLLSVIEGISYKPCEMKNIGNPCFEVGDVIVFRTKYDLIESYILQRRLTGIQAMKDNIIADGVQYYT